MARKQIVFIPYEKEKKSPSWAGIIVTFLIGLWPITAFLAFKKLSIASRNARRNDMMNIANTIDRTGEIPLAMISSRVGRSVAEVVADVQAMIERGYFPNGSYIDHGRGVVVVADQAASYDLRDIDDVIEDIAGMVGGVVGGVVDGVVDGFTRGRRRPPAPKHAQAQPAPMQGTAQPAPEGPKPAAPAQPKQPEPDRHEEILSEIRRLNAQIRDKAVSDRIDRLEGLTRSIFTVLDKHPEKENDVRTFMSYYLPTTLKLLNTYALMESQSYQGENITATKQKIENILDTLITAFEQKQDDLFREDAMDVAADVSVLETMLRKDGLVSDGGIDLHKAAAGKRAAGGH